MNVRECGKSRGYRAILMEKFRRMAQKNGIFPRDYPQQLVIHSIFNYRKSRFTLIDDHDYTQMKRVGACFRKDLKA